VCSLCHGWKFLQCHRRVYGKGHRALLVHRGPVVSILASFSEGVGIYFHTGIAILNSVEVHRSPLV
jgi:hypothetical protein